MTATNETIYKVISAKYKKDVKAEIKELEQMGYEIEKVWGDLRVRNPRTKRSVWLSFKILETYGRSLAFGSRVEHFDYHNFLETPIKNNFDPLSETPIEKMKRLKKRIETRNENIEHARKIMEESIANAIRQFEYDREYQTDSLIELERELSAMRKEYGLTK